MIGPSEVEAALAALVQTALPEMAAMSAQLPGRSLLRSRMEAIAREGGTGLPGVVLIAVSVPTLSPRALKRLEKQLRARDFVVALPSNRIVLLTADALQGDLPGLKRRFVGAVQDVVASAIPEDAVRISFPSREHGRTPQELIESLLGRSPAEA